MQEPPDNISIPSTVPVMTLKDTVLFPHSVLPLYIFEPRYQKMLKDVLKGNLLFGIIQEDTSQSQDSNDSCDEPPHSVGTIGIIRASHDNPDGTSNLVLQGLKRIQIKEIIQETPYRIVEIEPKEDIIDTDTEGLLQQKQEVIQFLHDYPHFTQGLPDEFIQFLDSIEDPSAYLDVTIYATCNDQKIKQRLLETINLKDRFSRYLQYLSRELDRENLYRLLQGETRDDEIDLN